MSISEKLREACPENAFTVEIIVPISRGNPEIG